MPAGNDLGAFEEGEAAALARDDGDGPPDFADGLPRVVLDQTSDEQRLAHLRRSVHEHHKRRRLLRLALHHRHCAKHSAQHQQMGTAHCRFCIWLLLSCSLKCFLLGEENLPRVSLALGVRHNMHAHVQRP